MKTSGKFDRRLAAELALPSDVNRLGDGEEKEQGVTLPDTETRRRGIGKKLLACNAESHRLLPRGRLLLAAP